MSKNFVVISVAYFSVLMLLFTSCSKEERFSKRVKVSLRNVGHQLLLANQDTSSLVLPIQKLDASKFELSFRNNLVIHPDTLVAVVDKNFSQASLSNNYILEVKDCEKSEVLYSYHMQQKKENAIIPCKGRVLPRGCYLIEVEFINLIQTEYNYYLYIIPLILALFLGLYYFKKKPHQQEKATKNEDTDSSLAIGSFDFYPEQNKLVKKAKEINLSKKECELLAILISKPNQIITREELTKKVWEDNGVFVGRSLDTYISKLRKKLQDDASIKITNIHGVGYKLQID